MRFLRFTWPGAFFGAIAFAMFILFSLSTTRDTNAFIIRTTPKRNHRKSEDRITSSTALSSTLISLKTINHMISFSSKFSSPPITSPMSNARDRIKGRSRSKNSRSLALKAADSDSDSNEANAKNDSSTKKNLNPNKKKTGSKKKKSKSIKKKVSDPALEKKQEIIQQLKAKMEEKKRSENDSNTKTAKESNQSKKGSEKSQPLLGKLINPFQAGQDLRQTLDSLTTLGRGLSEETKQKYFLDDRFLDRGTGSTTPRGATSSLSELSNLFGTNSLLKDAVDAPTYIPEVLVVGATGEIGRLVVRRLLLEGRFQVRVLVRDLYSRTLNLLGTGVTYCQGDLNNVESLEYALTDVDKIVYVAGAPRPDESDFQVKFQSYIQENNLQIKNDHDTNNHTNAVPIESNSSTIENLEWEQLSSILEVRAELAEQIDFIGMQNLILAYQNVRFADYGTSQAAKRSLFKFSGRPEDFNLFALDDEDDKADSITLNSTKSTERGNSGSQKPYYSDYDEDDEVDEDDEYEDFYEKYSDDIDEGDYESLLESRGTKDATVKSTVRWIRNQFGNCVFAGKVPRATATGGGGGEAAIVSSRLRSRENPDQGIDLSNAFAGFIVRLVSDGNKYEAFIRTGSYEKEGIEYVCEFRTETKPTARENKSRLRFTTVRLAFENFKPVRRKAGENRNEISSVRAFSGSDVQYVGFRFRSSSNIESNIRKRLSLSEEQSKNQNFYLSLSFVKVYRSQPEPEFIYLSDARIPPHIHSGMVYHERRSLVTGGNDSDMEQDEESSTIATTLFDEKTLKEITRMERSPEETYFKYRGEELLKRSGLAYTIIRVAGFNELPTSEASTIDIVKTNTDIVPVSRAEVAQVCVSALMDPCALNKSVYMTKKKSVGKVWDEEDISAKFETIPSDSA